MIATARVLLPIAALGQHVLAQDSDPLVHEMRRGLVRVVAAAGTADSSLFERIIEAFEAQVPVPGLPTAIFEGKLITVSLAAHVREGIEAWSSTPDDLIVMRLADVSRWPPSKLTRVIRHELAHLGLEHYLGHNQIPRWFSEGFAEWVAGGLTCEAEARIRLHLQTAQRDMDLANALILRDLGNPRLSYDLYASFFEYIVKRDRHGSVGAMMSSVRAVGAEAALVKTFGVDLSTLDLDWQRWLTREYGGPLDSNALTCAPSDE